MPPALDPLDRHGVRAWLTEQDGAALEQLWRRADEVRRAHVGDDVHLRGLIEVTNHCVRECTYCGIAACAGPLRRYRMTRDEILDCARQGRDSGFGTLVIQGGEDPGLTAPFVADVIRAIKRETGVAVTLSLGERREEDLRAWRRAGADRYLLRLETTDPELYRRIHPSLPGTVSNRLGQLLRMRELGYEIGTGVMIGMPGQTWDALANDIWTFRQYDMDMIGVGPYVPSPGTPLAGPLGAELAAPASEQVPHDELTTLKAMALTRLVCPNTNIPSTTALSVLDPGAGRANGLRRGANVVMPNLTPPQYRALYAIYPGKAGANETGQTGAAQAVELVLGLGRTVGKGPGGRRS